MIHKKLILILNLIFTSTLLSQSVSLFNGENLNGWNIHGTEKWYVENGNLICESGPDKEYGYLSTDKFYKELLEDVL